MDLPDKYRQHQAVFDTLMPVIGTELANGLHRAANVIFLYVQKTLRNHERDNVSLFAQAAHRHIYQIEALSEHLMTEGKSGNDLPDHTHLIVFNHFF